MTARSANGSGYFFVGVDGGSGSLATMGLAEVGWSRPEVGVEGSSGIQLDFGGWASALRLAGAGAWAGVRGQVWAGNAVE